MKKKICPQCGERCSATSAACSNCDTSLIRVTAIEENDPLFAPLTFCPRCNTKIAPSIRNCPECGEFIAKGSRQRSVHVVSSIPKSGNGFLYLFSALIPLIAFIAGAVMLASGDESRKEAGKIAILIGVISSLIWALIIFVT